MGKKRKNIKDIEKENLEGIESIELDSKKKIKHQHEEGEDYPNQDTDKNDKLELSINATIGTNKIKWNEIDIDKLYSLDSKDLRDIAKSIGISSTVVKKQVLISKIKFIINMKNDAINNKHQKEGNNPFNKSTFNQLVITPDKQGQNELLFWKVFKSKSVFKHIMSFLSDTSNPLSYDYIISVKDMLANNHINILKDKVKRNQYISFQNNNITYSLMFTKIQDDHLFYQSLFKNYKEQFTNDISGEIANLFIESNCLTGFRVFVQVFNYMPSIENLKNAIDLKSWNL